jgi:aspartate-semialdehyde dehydrogenase
MGRSFECVFFTTSNPGGKAPDVGVDAPPLVSATDIKQLQVPSVLISRNVLINRFL